MSCHKGVRALTVTSLIILAAFVVMVRLPTAQAATQIHWDTNQVLSSDVEINQDEELVIDAGVTVRLDPDVNLTIYGNITVNGAQTNPVYFEKNGVDPWGRINIFNADRKSHFYHPWISDTNLSIYAVNSDLYIKGGNITNSEEDGVHVTDGDVTIIEASFVNNGDGNKTESAIYLNHATGLIQGNNIVHNHHGIFMKEGSSVEVRDNWITDCNETEGVGILVRSNSGPVIDNNHILRNYDGIISNGSASIITNNTIDDNRYDGILMVEGDSAIVMENQISNNGDDGADINNGSTSRISSNEIYGNAGNGIMIHNASPRLDGNEIYGNAGAGIALNDTVCTAIGNSVHSNSYGYWINKAGSNLSSSDDDIYGNTMVAIFNQGGSAKLHQVQLSPHPETLMATDQSYTYFENGSMGASTAVDFNLTSSKVRALNLTYDSWTTSWSGYGAELLRMWYLGVEVLNKNGNPFPGVNVSLQPNTAEPPVNGTTNADGKVDWMELIERESTYTAPTLSERNWSPYLLNVSYEGYFNETVVTMNMSKNVTIFLDIPNQAPKLKVQIPDRSFPEDTNAYALYDLNDHFEDEDTLNYEIVYEEDDSKIDGHMNGTKLDFHTPTENWFGTQRFRVKATDVEALSTESNTFTVNVTPVNDPPVINPNGPFEVDQGKELTFTMTASDIDNPVADLTFRNDDIFIPEITVTLDPKTGKVMFRYDLPISSPTVIYLHFYVCDLEPLCSENTTVQVTVVAQNRPPVFTTDIPTDNTDKAPINYTWTYDVGVYDPDGDPLVLTLSVGPEGMVLNDRALAWRPNASQMGQHLVILNLTDGIHNVQQSFTLVVSKGNHAPEAEILSPASGAVLEEGIISFSGRAFDEDFDSLSYTWMIDGSIKSHDLGFSTPLSPGTYRISFNVSDGKVTSSANITIIVKKKDHGGTPGIGPTTTSVEDAPCMWLFLLMAIIGVVAVLLVNYLFLSRHSPYRSKGPDDLLEDDDEDYG